MEFFFVDSTLVGWTVTILENVRKVFSFARFAFAFFVVFDNNKLLRMVMTLILCKFGIEGGLRARDSDTYTVCFAKLEYHF
jgi:hypothetical protein